MSFDNKNIFDENTFKVIKYNNSYKILTPLRPSYLLRKYSLTLSINDADFFSEELVLLKSEEVEIFEKKDLKILSKKEFKDKIFVCKTIYLEKKKYQPTENTENLNTKIKYHQKKVERNLKSVQILPFDNFIFHKIMIKNYSTQICHFSEEAFGFMNLFLINSNNLSNNLKVNEKVCVIDDVKGVLALHLYNFFNFSNLFNKNKKDKKIKNCQFFSSKKKKFEYQKNIEFENFQNYEFTETFSIAFFAGNFNKIKFIEKVFSERYVIYIQFHELSELSNFLFKNTAKFTDISIKELLCREIEIKDYQDTFIHPKITSTLGKGFVVSFVRVFN